MKSVALLLIAAGQALAQQTAWGQCGGISWGGATTCVSGYTCTKLNDYYFQCIPGSASTTTTSRTSSSATTSVRTTSTSSTTRTTSSSTRTSSTTSSSSSPSGSGTVDPSWPSLYHAARMRVTMSSSRD